MAALAIVSCGAPPAATQPAHSAERVASARAQPPARPAIEGRVRDASGAPVRGAVVVAVPADAAGLMAARLAAAATSDGDGRFRLEPTPGAYMVTATAAGHLAAAAGPTGPGAGTPVEVALGTGGITVSGSVRSHDGTPRGHIQVLAIPTAGTGRSYVTWSAPDGAYQLTLAAGEYFIAADLEDTGFEPRLERKFLDVDEALDLTVARPESSPGDPAPVLAWLAREAKPLNTSVPLHGIADLEPLAQMVGDARIVGLGDATHGTREFYQLKHRMLELLVTRGFTTVALEADWAKARAIDDYVLGGRGDPRALLAGLSVWIWQTEEIVDLLTWMRRYNSDPRHARKLHIAGFDVKTTEGAARLVERYLARVAPDDAARAAPLLGALQGPAGAAAAPRPDGQEPALEALRAELQDRRADYVARSSAADWDVAEHAVVVLLQRARELRAGDHGPRVRDRHMAENVRWLVEHGEPGGKLVVWAHDGHVSFSWSWQYSMGMRLREIYGRDYLVIGFHFNQGSFQAIDRVATGGAASNLLAEFHVGPARDGYLEAVLGRAAPRFLVDLRTAPGDAADWLSHVARVRQADAGFVGENALDFPVAPARAYDLLCFIDTTTRAVPTPQARARYATPRR